MKNKKKIILSSLMGVFAIGILGFGSFAFYKSNSEISINTTAGNVNVELSNYTLTNKDNINPGDNDPTNPIGVRAGTSHDLSFSIANTGNKSIVTRHVLDIKAEDLQGLHPSTYFLLKDGKELEGKYYVMKDRTVKSATDVSDAFDEDIVAIRYIVNSDSLNGVGVSAEKENGITSSTGTYKYIFGMKKEATNIYQGKKVFVTAKIEAMQYRNTKDADWTTIYEDTLKGTVN